MVTALVGGSFGSEGKGLIAGKVGTQFDAAIRVGAANAGHTVYDQEGGKHVMQQIPCAAYANPHGQLLIGPGAQISPDIFLRELNALDAWRTERQMGPTRVYVDPRAHLITPDHIEREQATDLAARIGSTSTVAKEGIGAAQAARVMREAECVTMAEVRDFHPCVSVRDTVRMVADIRRKTDGKILLEGTQGTGLSLTTGFFPYTTSRNTSAAGLAADAGIAPMAIKRVILVMRAYPIRVAGASGPFYPDSEEITWDRINIDPEDERTTVTKLVRRVATFSMRQAVEAVRINGATEIALTFADYLVPEMAGVQDPTTPFPRRLRNLIDDIQQATDVPVSMVGTGPNSLIVRGMG